MTRIKTVWLNARAYTPTAHKRGNYYVTNTIVCENGIWFTADFFWSEQNFRWERVQ